MLADSHEQWNLDAWTATNYIKESETVLGNISFDLLE